MMEGEVQEPFNLSLLENSIHSGSVSFGRFEKESLSWERRSSFSHNRYLEEAERYSKPGSVTQMRAHFELHFKKKGIRFPGSIEAQPCGEPGHHQTCTEKDENLLEDTSPFGDSCVSYDDILVNSDDDDDHTSLSVSLEKTKIGRNDNEDDQETISSSSGTRLKSLKNVHKTVPCSTTKASTTKKHAVLTKGSSPSCNTKTSIDTKRQKELKPKKIVKTVASQTQTTSKKAESLTPLVGTREKRTTTIKGFNFRSSERAEKRKEEKVKAVVPKDLNFKARPLPKSTQARPQYKPTSQANTKSRDDHSSVAGCNRSLVNGPSKSKLNSDKHKVDTHRSPTIEAPQTTRRGV